MILKARAGMGIMEKEKRTKRNQKAKKRR